MTLEENLLPNLLVGFFSAEEYCELRGINKRQAQRERAARVGPPWVKLGRATYYSVAGFREWLAAQEIRPVRVHSGRRPRGEAA